MIISNFFQLNLILCSILSGFFIGVSFDLYRVIRGLEVPNKILGFIEDILFWALVGVITFIFLFNKSDAIMNFYVYTFIIVGILLYIIIFSEKLVFYENKLLIFILGVIRVILKWFTYPIRLLFNKLFCKE